MSTQTSPRTGSSMTESTLIKLVICAIAVIVLFCIATTYTLFTNLADKRTVNVTRDQLEVLSPNSSHPDYVIRASGNLVDLPVTWNVHISKKEYESITDGAEFVYYGGNKSRSVLLKEYFHTMIKNIVYIVILIGLFVFLRRRTT